MVVLVSLEINHSYKAMLTDDRMPVFYPPNGSKFISSNF